jgi:serine/threonine protein kinase
MQFEISRIIHRDLKPENILIKNEKTLYQNTIKLKDI